MQYAIYLYEQSLSHVRLYKIICVYLNEQFTQKHLTNKMFSALCLLSVIVFGFSTVETELIPSVLCKRDSVNYSNCAKAAMQEAWPQFVKGLPEFNLPPLDPLFYEFGNFVFDRGAVHGVVNVSNFIFVGLAKMRVLAVRSHFADEIFRLEIDIHIPEVEGSGTCDAVGTLGEFRMSGKGYFNVSVEVLQGTGTFIGHVANDTWTIEHVYAVPSIKKMKIYLENLFNGNKELNNLAMIFVNEFWPMLYRVALPEAIKTWDPWLCEMANRFFSKVSFSQIFK